MTTQTLVGASRTAPGAPPTRRGLLVPVVLAASFLVTQAVAQAVTPFVRQDDWPFLLPPDTTGVLPPAYYNSSEGRWLNTGWWWLVGQHGTPTTAALTYAVAYAALVAGAWRVVHRSGIRPSLAVDALLGVALFASSVWVQLLYWPGALTPSAIVGAAALWLLPWAVGSRLRILLWLLLSGAAAVLTYPPVGLVLLVVAVLALRERPWRTVLLAVGGWMGGFALGVATAYGLNWVFNGHFGLDFPAWRENNPLTSVDAFTENAGRWVAATCSLWAGQWWLALIGVVAAALGWRDPAVRARLLRLLVAVAVAVGIDAAQTLTTGIVTEARGQLWTWLVAVLPVALLLLRRRDGQRAMGWDRSERIPALLLAVLAVAGVLAWRGDIGAHQATRMQYAAIAERATVHEPGAEPSRLVVYQDPGVKDTRDGRLMASTLFMAIRQQTGGVLPRWCRGDECLEIARRSASGGDATAAGWVVPIDSPAGLSHVVGVVVPPPPDWL